MNVFTYKEIIKRNKKQDKEIERKKENLARTENMISGVSHKENDIDLITAYFYKNSLNPDTFLIC